MKKYIIVLSIFILLFGGLFAFMKIMDDKHGVSSSDSSSYVSGSSNGALGSLQGEGTVLELGADTEVVENPEGEYIDEYHIIVDAKLSNQDWSTRSQAGLSNENIVATMERCNGYYAYDLLSEEKKQLYAEILMIMEGVRRDIPLCNSNEVIIEQVAGCVLLDHPEIFYVEGYTYVKHMFAGAVQKILFTPNYTRTVDEIASEKQQIDQYVQACFQKLPETADDYQKVKYVYEFIILNTEYNLDAPDNQNICSVFLHRESVCLGYAKAIQYLLQQLGMEAAVVTGSVVTGESHAWNLVKVNGQYYYVDATWGDASYFTDTGTGTALSTINYDYLCVTTADLLKSHIIDNPVSVPHCGVLIDNYYVKEGLYLTSLDGLLLEDIFNKAYSNGWECVSIRCSDATVFQSVQEHLLDGQQIFKYLQSGTQTLGYTTNEELYTYTFML